MNKLKHLTPIALGILLSGCAVGPDYQEPTVSMAEAYINQQAGEKLEQGHWWLGLNDPVLNTLVQDMQSQSLTLQMASQRLKMAKSYQTVVESFKVPTVNVGAGYYNYQLSKNDSLLSPALNPIGDSVANLPPQIGGMTLLDNQHQGGFVGASIAWELDIFGRLDRQANAAQIRKEQVEIYQQGLTTLITADLIHNYLQYRGAQKRYALMEENLEDQQRTEELVQKMVSSGYGSELDLAQAQALTAATEALLPQLEIAQQVHKQRIATLLNEPLSSVDVRLASEVELPELAGTIPVGLPSDLLKRRADIRFAEREMAAINEEWAASVANRYPKFFLTGAPGVSADSFDDLFSSDSFGWVGAAGIHWNVFDGGRGEAMVEMNEARFDSAALGYQHSVNSAVAEVDSLLFAYGRSQQHQKSIEKAYQSAETALTKAESLYRAGLIDYMSVLDAQRQKRLLLDQQVAAKLQTSQVTIGLYKSMGGDWSVEEQS